MRKIQIAAFTTCFIVSLISQSAAAQSATSEGRTQNSSGAANTGTNTVEVNTTIIAISEIEALRHRIELLEGKNRELTALLDDFRAKLEKHGANLTGPVSPKPAAQPDNNDDLVRWSDLLGEGNRFKVSGFFRLDIDVDSQRPNNAQTPLFITSKEVLSKNVSGGSYSMHPRLTRLGLDYSGPAVAGLGNGKLSGKFEVDFENGGTESRQIIRIRHAFLKMNWKRLSMLAGQTWDVVSPLTPTVNNDTLMWNAGNVGDRRPQLQLAFDTKIGRGKWSFIGSAGLTGAIDAQDLDADGSRDGEESRRPNLQMRVGYTRPFLVKDQPAGIGISGFYGWLNTTRPISGQTAFNIQLINIDYTLPIFERLALRGELWGGSNMSDVRGGAGQGINTTNGRVVRGFGGWSEVSLKFLRNWSVHPGFSVDDPVNRDVQLGGRTRNRAYYIANRFEPGGKFLIGIDYLRWITNYKDKLSGTDNRVNVFIQYNF